ncbi:ABC-2 type transport system permease protein [Paenibacillus phyllosphaerae]|uniref:ABC-2 type transport system permease protein n=1 Tax=Paenibacillus phyllosphaerae TaxID=274593 RepID=A0A7W5B223_9BACL|nr:ABC transporter permease [Paenibacillus phyllosphaerae]MBB3112998.1 ABC-2 type transport system permease protein [Paenibacillus phyllosphaerae]
MVQSQRDSDRPPPWQAGSLFRRRAVKYWVDQWRVWRTVVDWIVLLYLFVPALLIGGGVFIGWLQHPPEWLMHIPLALGQGAAILILVLFSRLRTFTEEADVLFLLQRKKWMRKLRIYGFLYSACLTFMLSLLIVGMLLPLFVAAHGQAWGNVLLFVLHLWLWALIAAVWMNLVAGRHRGWRRNVRQSGATLTLAFTFMAPYALSGGYWALAAVSLAIGGAALLLLVRMKLQAVDTFESDVRLEREAALASTALLLSQSDVVIKPRPKHNRPLLFRRSQRLFRSRDVSAVLAGNAMKGLLRQFAFGRGLLQFLGLGLAAVTLIDPVVIKMLVVAGQPVIVGLYLNSCWESFLHDPFVARLGWGEKVQHAAGERLRLWLSLPSALLIGALAGVQSFGALGALVGVAAALYVWGLCRVMTELLQLRIKKNRSA